MWQFLATRTGHVASTAFTADPGVQPLGDIHSWWLLNEPWGLQTAKHLPTCHLVHGDGRGLFDRVLASSTLKGQFSPPQYLCCLPASVSDPVLSC